MVIKYIQFFFSVKKSVYNAVLSFAQDELKGEKGLKDC